MLTLILLFLIAMSTCQSLSCCQFGKYYPRDPSRASSVFSVLCGVVCTVFTIVFTACTKGLPLDISLPTVLLPANGKKFAPRDTIKHSFTFNKRCFAWGIASALSTSIAINIMIWILSKINVTIVYSFHDGGVLLVSILISLIFLGEKCTFTKMVGIFLSISAIMMLSIKCPLKSYYRLIFLISSLLHTKGHSGRIKHFLHRKYDIRLSVHHPKEI